MRVRVSARVRVRLRVGEGEGEGHLGLLLLLLREQLRFLGEQRAALDVGRQHLARGRLSVRVRARDRLRVRGRQHLARGRLSVRVRVRDRLRLEVASTISSTLAVPPATSCSMCRICRLGGTPSKRAAARNLRKVVLPMPLRPTWLGLG